MNKKLQIGVKIILLNSTEDMYLGITRNSDKKLHYSENIDIPGGRIELGEEPLDGLRRELMEEIGYKLKSEPIILDASNILNDENRQIVRITYFAKENINLDEVKLGDEHQKAELVKLMESKNFHPLLNRSICLCKKLLGK